MLHPWLLPFLGMNISLGYASLVLVLYVLAVMRLVRLVNYDTVLDPLRLLIARRASTARIASDEAYAAGQPIAGAAHSRRRARWNTLAYFLECPWCVGFWLSLATAVVPVLIIGWPWWAVVGVAFACSQLVGMLAPLSAEDVQIVEGGQ